MDIEHARLAKKMMSSNLNEMRLYGILEELLLTDLN